MRWRLSFIQAVCFGYLAFIHLFGDSGVRWLGGFLLAATCVYLTFFVVEFRDRTGGAL